MIRDLLVQMTGFHPLVAHSQLRQRKSEEEEGEEGDKDGVKVLQKLLYILYIIQVATIQSHVLHASGIVHDGSLLYFVMENALAILPK